MNSSSIQPCGRRGSAHPRMTASEAGEARYRLNPDAVAARAPADGPEFEILPAGLGDLVDRAERLHARVLHLDGRMHRVADETPHPVQAQFDRLTAAFGG